VERSDDGTTGGPGVEEALRVGGLGRHQADLSVQALLQGDHLPGRVRVIASTLVPVLVNRYYRWYFATLDGRYRVTVDTGLTYHRVGHLANSFAHRQVDYDNLVVELKYQSEHAGQANRVSSYFPFRMTRNSKYVTGIERVYYQ